jgi:hypothetical protein
MRMLAETRLTQKQEEHATKAYGYFTRVAVERRRNIRSNSRSGGATNNSYSSVLSGLIIFSRLRSNRSTSACEPFSFSTSVPVLLPRASYCLLLIVRMLVWSLFLLPRSQLRYPFNFLLGSLIPAFITERHIDLIAIVSLASNASLVKSEQSSECRC